MASLSHLKIGDAGGRRIRILRLSNSGFGALIVLPALAILIAVLVYPLVYSGFMSLHAFYLARPQDFQFIGLGNYIEIIQNKEFKRALINTVTYAGVAVPIEFVLGLGLALALANIDLGRGVIRMLLTLPMMLAPAAMGLMWKFMYNDQLGIINYLIREWHIAEQPPLWLADPHLAIYSIIAVDIWATTPVIVILMLAGLLSISPDLYEAAEIDGASTVYSFRHITLPLLRPIILVALLLRGMDAFRVFDIVYIMTKGGPALRSDVLSLLAYRTAFTDLSIGQATAIAWIMTIILLVSGVLLVRALRQEGSQQ